MKSYGIEEKRDWRKKKNGFKKREILTELDDEKPTAVRQCLAALNYMLLFKVELVEKVRKKLVSIDITKYKDSMQPLIEKDIEGILKQYY